MSITATTDPPMPDPIRTAELRTALTKSMQRDWPGVRYGEWPIAETMLTLLDVAEAANDALVHVRAAVRALPVRDATREAHFELEHARLALSPALARLDFTADTKPE